ncbi:hypothetical protein GF325_16030 [Candidatus Bathyarchaeota archaeon]|nr:hypothetical protein [Candidatus Bathyarchaeota archaeon]
MDLDLLGTGDAITTSNVIIVGGSFSGNLLAWILATRGIHAHVLEEHKRVGLPMECAGIVSSKICKLIPIPRKFIHGRVSTAEIYVPGDMAIKVRTRDAPVVIDRTGLDDYYHEMAKRKGAVYHLGERVNKITRDGEYWLVETSRGIYKTQMLVGCDGAKSIVARSAGMNHDFITGKQVLIHVKDDADKPCSANTCELHFDPRWNELFAWVIPRGSSYFRVGLCAKFYVATKLNQFFSSRFGLTLEEARRGDRQKKISIDILKTTGGLIPVGHMHQCAFAGMILLGDAACQVKATTGGGLVMSSLAATYAARAICKSLQQDKYSKKFLARHYQKPCRRQLALTLKMHYILHLGLSYLEDSDYSFLSRFGTQAHVRKWLLSAADMDFPLKFILRVFLEPSFISWVIRFLFRNPFLLVASFKTLVTLPRSRKDIYPTKTNPP